MKKLIFAIILILCAGLAIAAPDVREVSHSCVGQSGAIKCTITLQNVAPALPENQLPTLIYEIQPRQKQALSIISGQSACLASSPENVHRTITSLLAGDTATFTLTTPQLNNGIYDVYGVTFTNCCWVGGQSVACQPSQPYLGFGEYGNRYLTTITIKDGKIYSQTVCGDGTCVAPESNKVCPKDCPAKCGDDFCNADVGENTQWCGSDCLPASSYCNNGVCEPEKGENPTACPKDCTAPPAPAPPPGSPPPAPPSDTTPPGDQVGLAGLFMPLVFWVFVIIVVAVGFYFGAKGMGWL